jgi:hypothetical protein
MTNPNKTDLNFVIDKSGSMQPIAAAMSQGINELIDKQRTIPGECTVTVYEFSDAPRIAFAAQPLTEVPEYRLEPGGQTALYDAMAYAIDETGKRLAAMPEDQRPGQVLFVIITDGQENYSRKYSLLERGRERVFDKVTHQREKYSWEFVFMGANQDAYATATGLGISALNNVTYTATKGGTLGALEGLSRGVLKYRCMATRGRMDGVYDQKAHDAIAGAPAVPMSKQR